MRLILVKTDRSGHRKDIKWKQAWDLKNFQDSDAKKQVYKLLSLFGNTNHIRLPFVSIGGIFFYSTKSKPLISIQFTLFIKPLHFAVTHQHQQHHVVQIPLNHLLNYRYPMGKGGGCVPSKKKSAADSSNHPDSSHPPPPIPAPEQPTDTPVSDSAAVEQRERLLPIAKLKVFIVFYSMYGHVEGLAKRMKKGVESVDGVEALLFRVPETLSKEVLQLMNVPPRDDSIPEISAEELVEADGVLFGFPTRYGCMAAQMKAFFDSTGQLWQNRKLAGKPAGFFVSTGTQGGGQETTA